MFYELDITDPLGQYPWKRGTQGISDHTFEGNIDVLAQITLLMDPDAALADKGQGSSSVASFKTKAETMSLIEVEVPNLLPDG
jgi:hypothetical protein